MTPTQPKLHPGAFAEMAGLLVVALLWAVIYAFVPDGEDRAFVAGLAMVVLSPLLLLGLYAASWIAMAIAKIIISAFRALHPKR